MRRPGEAFEKMVGKEIQLLNRNAVLHKRSLKDLLAEKGPVAITKDKDGYVFDKQALKKAAEKYPEHKHGDIMLPAYFYVDPEVPNQCYIRDELDAGFLKKIVEGLEGYKFKKGTMWLSKAVANKVMREYPTLFQYFYLP